LIVLAAGFACSADPLNNPAAPPLAPDALALVSATGDLPGGTSAGFLPIEKPGNAFAVNEANLSPLWVPGTTSDVAGKGPESWDDTPLRPVADDHFGLPMGLVILFGALLVIYYSDGYRKWYQRMFGALDQY
jgi:hypothetical protein